jgi:hypothetical protein
MDKLIKLIHENSKKKDLNIELTEKGKILKIKEEGFV